MPLFIFSNDVSYYNSDTDMFRTPSAGPSAVFVTPATHPKRQDPKDHTYDIKRKRKSTSLAEEKEILINRGLEVEIKLKEERRERERLECELLRIRIKEKQKKLETKTGSRRLVALVQKSF